MDLLTYNYPTVNAVDMAFSTFDTIAELKEEAYKRGFDRSTPYNRLFNQVFFGTVQKVTFKKELTPEQIAPVWQYCKALMKSFAPKHEHKEAVCAMLMSEVLELAH